MCREPDCRSLKKYIFIFMLYAIRNEAPKKNCKRLDILIHTPSSRLGLNMMAAITPRGQMHFMIVKGTVRSEEIVEFLNRLMKGHESQFQKCF